MKKNFGFLFIILFTGSYAAHSQPAKNNSVPGTSFFYSDREDLLEAPDCNPSEVYLKKKVKSLIAKRYENFPHIAVDFTSFKGQHGYNDKKFPNQFVYPYEIEMFVHLKRKVQKDGKDHAEYQTWKIEGTYEYATRANKKCEFYEVKGADIKLVRVETVKL